MTNLSSLQRSLTWKKKAPQRHPPTIIRGLGKCNGDAEEHRLGVNTRRRGASTREFAALPRFGPVHGEDTELNQFIKDLAWRHALEKEVSGSDRIYLISMAKIEQRAKESYDDPALDKTFSPLVFRRRMVVDGCLFLQLALHILGGGELLGYPETHLYFGKHVDACYWLPAMFHVGNQIPYIVIRALMEQTFFQKVIRRGIERGTWQQPKREEQEDLEAGREKSKKIRFPSAGELLKSGIVLKKAEGGITNIHFRNLIFRAYLYVPPLTIDRHTGDVLAWLRNYEQTLDESDRQVLSYIRLIKELAQTYTDIKILKNEGIIQLEEEELGYTNTMVEVLNKFVTMGSYTLNFRHVRGQIREYGGPPWRLIGTLVGLFTVIQTIFSVLAYVKPPKSST